MKADRYNAGKPLLHYVLTAPHAVQGLAQVMTYGATKYSRDNWKKGLPADEVVDSLLRHLTAYLYGEKNDQESGLPHVAHALCNAMFLAEFELRGDYSKPEPEQFEIPFDRERLKKEFCIDDPYTKWVKQEAEK